MMARNTNVPFKGRIQKRKTHDLQIITFGLQRAAGPFRRANSRHWYRQMDDTHFVTDSEKTLPLGPLCSLAAPLD
jgi:hypothetical protein